MVETAQKVNGFMDMIVQIYEIQSPREAEVMIELGVDHVGSVLLSEPVWKDTDLKTVVNQVQNAGLKSSLIPLFQSVDVISAAIDYYRPDILHFCDMLPNSTDNGAVLDGMLNCQRVIRQRFPEIQLMRSIPIGTTGNGDIIPSLALAALFEPLSDWFLTDTLIGVGDSFTDSQQPVIGFVGITGNTCDWDVAAELVTKSGIPVILAGGIGPHNVQDGIEKTRPAGVDSCTLTNAVDTKGESIRFRKDPVKVRALVQKARKY
jgi:phosphoribosylanthranilate isomerase